MSNNLIFFFFSSRRRHTRWNCDWSSDVCSSDLITRVFFRLHPLPKETRTISCVTTDVREAERLVLAIQNSKLAHSALQICCGTEMQSRVDVLFEGTEEGLSAQSVQLKLMASEAKQGDRTGDVWNRRHELWLDAKKSGEFAVAKFAALPAQIAETVEMMEMVVAAPLRWSAVA